MIDTLPAPVQRRYVRRAHLVTGVRHHSGHIVITRFTPVKRILSRDRWKHNGRGWEMVSSGHALFPKEIEP